MSVHIVTDSTSYLTPGAVSEGELAVVPVKVSLNEVFYREFSEISPDEFYAQQAAGAKYTTTQPSPEDFMGVYARLTEDPQDQVLSIHLSSKVSGTLNSAYLAAQQIDPGRIHLYDSLTSGLGLGFMVMEAVRLATDGMNINGIVKALDAMRERIHIYFLLGTTKYLVKSGRINKAIGVAANILQIKPILTVRNGLIEMYDKPRTMGVALERLRALVAEAVAKGVDRVGFHYVSDRLPVERMQRELMATAGIPSVITQLGPGVGCHMGPETVAVVLLDRAIEQKAEPQPAASSSGDQTREGSHMLIHIVTDSTSYLPEGFATQHGIDIVPLKITVDGVLHREFVDIDSDQFYQRQSAGAKAVTSQPGPEDFVALYKRLLASSDDEVLGVHISSLMSGTLNSANAAAAIAGTQRVRLYDSKMAGLGLGFMVMEAVRLAEEGASASEIVAALDAMQARIHVYFLVGTLDYLVAGARIGKAAGVAGSILQIKPILTIKDGLIDVYDRPRTMRVARDRIWKLIDEAAARGIEQIGFHYAGNKAEVEALQQDFERRTGMPSLLSQLGPVVGGNTGPDTLGVVIVEKAR
ncbi:MAG: DegV family protein [Candidatus Cryosericum sp.]